MDKLPLKEKYDSFLPADVIAAAPSPSSPMNVLKAAGFGAKIGGTLKTPNQTGNKCELRKLDNMIQ